ncbi:hypothetical protein Bca101_025146 [Brassica carinata]
MDFLEVVWTSRKSSGLPGSILTLSSFISSGVQACLCRGSGIFFIWFLTRWFSSSIWICFSDLEDFWDDLLFSRLNYNALDDLPVSRLDNFQEVVWTFWKISWKSSELPVSRLEVLWTSWEFSDTVFFHIKWNPSLSL